MSNAVGVKWVGKKFAAFTCAAAFGGKGCSVVVSPYSAIVCVRIHEALGTNR